MAANDYICDLDDEILLQLDNFMSHPPGLTVSTAVTIDPGTGIVSMMPTLPSVELATTIDGDTGNCAEAGGPASSHQPFPPWLLQYIKLHYVYKLFIASVI